GGSRRCGRTEMRDERARSRPTRSRRRRRPKASGRGTPPRSRGRRRGERLRRRHAGGLATVRSGGVRGCARWAAALHWECVTSSGGNVHAFGTCPEVPVRAARDRVSRRLLRQCVTLRSARLQHNSDQPRHPDNNEALTVWTGLAVSVARLALLSSLIERERVLRRPARRPPCLQQTLQCLLELATVARLLGQVLRHEVPG